MTEVESELLTALHRQWIATRNPKDGDRFSFFLAELVQKDAKNRYPAFPQQESKP